MNLPVNLNMDCEPFSHSLIQKYNLLGFFLANQYFCRLNNLTKLYFNARDTFQTGT